MDSRARGLGAVPRGWIPIGRRRGREGVPAGAPIRGISSTGWGDGAGRRVGDQGGSHGQLLALMARRFGVDVGRACGPISFAQVRQAAPIPDAA